jgi:amine acid ABC transporter, permease protein, 3-TM region, His/Glu/Gln/Arg/opine family
LLWFTVVPAVKFLLVDAVWTGKDRTACLPEAAGHMVGACWPFVQAKFSQFIYGFYPEAERWRVNLTFFLAALLLLPLLIPRLPAKGLNAGLFFIVLPVIAFFLLHGGGLDGFGVSWTAGLLSGFNDSIAEGGQKLARAGEADGGHRTAALVAGKADRLLSTAISYLIWPLTWLRDQIQASGRAVWTDFAATAAIVSILLFALNGGFRTGWRSLIVSVAIFAGVGIVIAVMGLDHGGLPIVDTRLWGGLLVTLVVSVTGIVASMPVGIALALGRRSTIPLIRVFSVMFIEFWRGIPLITVLFFATYMLPLFVPAGFTIDGLVRP